jgi:hypothetical protein
MKKYLKEIIICILQLLMFYVYPLIVKPFNPIGMVLTIVLITLILSIVIAIISDKKIKYFYPEFVFFTFIPSVFIYYNESALVHSIWYFVDSLIGIGIGTMIYLVMHYDEIK